MDGTFTEGDASAAMTAALGLILLAAAIILVGVFIVRSGNLPHPGPLIVSLSLLTAIALVGGIATSNGEVLTLAATGLGALAGSVSAVYTTKQLNKLDDGKDKTGEADQEE